MTLASGELRAIEYRLRPNVTGFVFAGAGAADGGVVTATVQLTMGVSETGIPLSPSTLVLPHYAQYVAPELVAANLQLLGLGYSLATAPVSQYTARFPRVIRTDVFQRAVDIARAGQRIFITNGSAEARRDAAVNLSLDLLGNASELREWDELRRQESAGAAAGAAVISELETTLLADGLSFASALDVFSKTAAHRRPWAQGRVE